LSDATSGRPSLSIIIPFHKGLALLARALQSLSPRREGDELIIAADGAVEDCRPLAAAHGAGVVAIPGPQGPAAARNAAAASAIGDVLVFVDADVVAPIAAVERVAEILRDQPGVAAVFGAYDDQPADAGFVSQYKNLAHAYFHRDGGGAAQTFWAGFGAVRRDAFMQVGGFDERFERPSIEDIDLGYRLSAAGYRLLLEPSLAVCHLKRWTLWSMLKSDVLDRGIPWTQLIHRYGRFGGLNTGPRHQWSVAIAYLALLSAVLGLVDATFAWPAVPLLVLLAVLGSDYYRFFWQKRGAAFALRVFPVHVLYHLYNGMSFVVGTILFVATMCFAESLPGALPAEAKVQRHCSSR
jgi:GT2 family glycosyltransferase